MSLAGPYDVIVLGSGIAGLASGLAAHENGLRPVLIEKAEQLGFKAFLAKPFSISEFISVFNKVLS